MGLPAARLVRMNWREWFKSDHTRYLELEVLRLRAELTKWQDAALQSKGLPAISKPEPGQSFQPRPRMTPSQFKRKYEELSGKADAKN